MQRKQQPASSSQWPSSAGAATVDLQHAVGGLFVGIIWWWCGEWDDEHCWSRAGAAAHTARTGAVTAVCVAEPVAAAAWPTTRSVLLSMNGEFDFEPFYRCFWPSTRMKISALFLRPCARWRWGSRTTHARTRRSPRKFFFLNPSCGGSKLGGCFFVVAILPCSRR